MVRSSRPSSETSGARLSSTSIASLFPPTDWGLVLSAGDERGPALERLCGMYWAPAYAYVRRLGYDRERALDLVQRFFARVTERNALERLSAAPGPFRVWLLDALRRFCAGGANAEHGSGADRFDAAVGDPRELDAIDRAAVLDSEPERDYARVLALRVIERALGRLEREQAERGRAQRFAALRPWLSATPTSEELTELGNALGLGAISTRIAVHAVRQRFGAFLRSEIENLLEKRNDSDALRAEMDTLLDVLGIMRSTAG